MYDSRALRTFVGIDLAREPVPDGIAVMRFRHRLEQPQLCAGIFIFDKVGRILQRRELRLPEGTIVDATLIAAPNLTAEIP